MRVLLDENMPHKLTRLFAPEVEAITVGQRGWKGMRNGDLLRAAQQEFDVFITTDKGIPHQQNLRVIKLIVILLEVRSNRYEDLAPLIGKIGAVLQEAQPGEIVRVAD